MPSYLPATGPNDERADLTRPISSSGVWWYQMDAAAEQLEGGPVHKYYTKVTMAVAPEGERRLATVAVAPAPKQGRCHRFCFRFHL